MKIVDKDGNLIREVDAEEYLKEKREYVSSEEELKDFNNLTKVVRLFGNELTIIVEKEEDK